MSGTIGSVLLSMLQKTLLIAGFALLAQWAMNAFDSHAFQTAGESVLESGESSGAVMGRIEIERLGITAIVAEGWDEATLKSAVGHITPTARPGAPGNCALAGHRDTFLRGLGRVRVNDVIRFVTTDSTFTYRVEWTEIVEPRRVDVLDPTESRSLTLLTCYPFNYIGHAPQRFIVRASQIDAVAAEGF